MSTGYEEPIQGSCRAARNVPIGKGTSLMRVDLIAAHTVRCLIYGLLLEHTHRHSHRKRRIRAGRFLTATPFFTVFIGGRKRFVLCASNLFALGDDEQRKSIMWLRLRSGHQGHSDVRRMLLISTLNHRARQRDMEYFVKFYVTNESYCKMYLNKLWYGLHLRLRWW